MIESLDMVKIRLTRTGRKHQPHYRIVAIDSRKKRDGDYLEKIGYYNPRTKPPTLQLDKELLQKWLDRGAQPTDTVFDLLVREGILKESKLRKKRVDMMIERSKKLATEDETEDTETPKAEAQPKEQSEKQEVKKEELAEDSSTSPKQEKEPKKEEKSEKEETKKEEKPKDTKEKKEEIEKPEDKPDKESES